MDYTAKILSKLPVGAKSVRNNFRNLVAMLQAYLPEKEIQQVLKAYDFGASAHEGQTRKSGEPYISHPIAVARTLAELKLDRPTIISGILHDVIEDTQISLQEVKKIFGDDVASLVDGVSKLDQIRFTNRAEAQAESFRKMILAIIEDIRVILIKLADRMHNMQTLKAMPRSKQERIARETLEIYAPIANRLGINHMKVALEDLGFRYLYPFRYAVLQNALKKNKGSQKQILKKIATAIKKIIKEENLEADVLSREKRLYSIYKKMSNKKILLNDVLDVYGFRIIVNNVNTCYQILGVIHGLYKPMPGRFKDHIAIPRINGYQSLHTTLIGPKGIPIEVQIRTKEMHKVAESGVAAHWQYKASNKSYLATEQRTREWLQKLKEIDKLNTSEEFLENVKVDLSPDKIYVFTPEGDILPLPKGATIIDFAYAVHTDIGNKCITAKVNRSLTPLHNTLESGQTIEIITARDATPNPGWLSSAITAKARSSIRQYMTSMRSTESISLGKRLLDRSLKDLGSSLRKTDKKKLGLSLKELNLSDTNELFKQIGLGERFAPITARYLIKDQKNKTDLKTPGLIVSGTEGMVLTYGKCCYPIPGDQIIGYISAGRGIVIHRNSCGNLTSFRKHPEKWMTVSWQNNIDSKFASQVHLDIANKTGVLAEVASNIADSESNIEEVTVSNRDDTHSIMHCVLWVSNRKHLAKIIRNLRKMEHVHKINRDH